MEISTEWRSLGLEGDGDEVDWKMINSRDGNEEQLVESWVSKKGKPVVPSPAVEGGAGDE